MSDMSVMSDLSCAAARRNLSIVFLATGVPATSHSFRMSGQKAVQRTPSSGMRSFFKVILTAACGSPRRAARSRGISQVSFCRSLGR
jgi:hypothetical protein